MFSSINLWMSLAGLVYFAAGVLALRRDLSAARGWGKLICLGSVFVAASLAAFAPEHFRGPEFVQEMVPLYMPARWFWAYFVGFALLAAATSLTARKLAGLSSMLLGLMFFLFVCILYLPSALRHPLNRFAWAYALRDLTFAAGAWALTAQHFSAAAPRQAKWFALFARAVLAIAAIYYGAEHFLHPEFAPGVPLEMISPAWVPFPRLWGCAAGSVMLAAGVALALNKRPQVAAAAIGALMVALTLGLYLPVLLLAVRGTAAEFNDALNYAADTLLYAGAALAVAGSTGAYREIRQTQKGAEAALSSAAGLRPVSAGSHEPAKEVRTNDSAADFEARFGGIRSER